jgi:hypothetical protein
MRHFFYLSTHLSTNPPIGPQVYLICLSLPLITYLGPEVRAVATTPTFPISGVSLLYCCSPFVQDSGWRPPACPPACLLAFLSGCGSGRKLFQKYLYVIRSLQDLKSTRITRLFMSISSGQMSCMFIGCGSPHTFQLHSFFHVSAMRGNRHAISCRYHQQHHVKWNTN